MNQEQDEVKTSVYSEDMNPFSEGETQSGVLDQIVEEDDNGKVDPLQSDNIYDSAPSEKVDKSINSENDTAEKEGTSVNNEKFNDTVDAEKATDSKEKEYPVPKKKVKKKKPFPKTKSKHMKYKKQDASFSSENHPVIAILLWCVKNLIADKTYTGTQNFLVTSGHFKTFAKLRLRRQPFFESENHVPTRYNIHLYTPDIFTLLRKKFNVTEKCFENSLGREIPIEFTEKCKTFLSPDGLFRVVLISEDEKEQFQRILPEYFKHIIENNGETCLPKFVSLLLVSLEKIRYFLLVSKNTVLPTPTAARNFPVKGSVLRKNALQNRADLETGSIKIFFDEEEEKKKLHKIIARDIEFLRSCGAIHYQLFISEYKPEELKTEHLEMLDTHPENFNLKMSDAHPEKSNVSQTNEHLEDSFIAEVEVSLDGEASSEDIYNYMKKRSSHADELQEETITAEEPRRATKAEEGSKEREGETQQKPMTSEEPSEEVDSKDELPRLSKQSLDGSVEGSSSQDMVADRTESNEQESTEAGRVDAHEVDEVIGTNQAESNQRIPDSTAASLSGIQFHKENFQCHHEVKAVLGKSTTDSSRVLYCFEFRDILKSYTCRRKAERLWKTITLGEYAMFASTVCPDDYAKRLLVVANRLFK